MLDNYIHSTRTIDASAIIAILLVSLAQPHLYTASVTGKAPLFTVQLRTVFDNKENILRQQLGYNSILIVYYYLDISCISDLNSWIERTRPPDLSSLVMAEAAAAVGLAASIAAFVELGVTVVKRLKEFHDDVDDVPEVFRSVKNELPLTINTLERTMAQAKASHLSLATTQALTPLVDSCLDEVIYLDERLEKLLPSRDDTGWERTLKALKSVYQNKDIQESVAELHKHILLLAFHQATSAAEYGQKAAAQEQLKEACTKPAKTKPETPKKANNKPNALPEQVRQSIPLTNND
jgi:N-terminal domain on NACHT_NTPase and P-loop NTPases